jgi:predicted metal-dependent enzyme (double-stranded beta helix superfamily)
VWVFDLEAFLAELTASAQKSDSRRAAKGILERALSAPDAVASAIAPTAGGISLLHQSPDLTVINIAWAPRMQLMPHDHCMWAIIGIYAGVEDNQFYRRGPQGELAETTGRRLDAGEVCVLGTDAIHAVANPTDRLTGAVHVYGGDFVNQPRSQWGPGDFVERPYDLAEINRQFYDANRASGLVT